MTSNGIGNNERLDKMENFVLLFLIFFEHSTAINPIKTLNKEMTNANPKPIFLLRPKHPTP